MGKIEKWGVAGMVALALLWFFVTFVALFALVLVEPESREDITYELVCFNEGYTAYTQIVKNLEIDGPALRFTVPNGERRVVTNALCFAAERTVK